MPEVVNAQGRTDQIAITGQATHDGNGTYSGLDYPALNNAGQVMFRADLIGTSGGTIDNVGVFRGNSDLITQLARKGQAAPDGNGTILGISPVPMLSDSGQTAFYISLTGTIGGSNDNTAIFRGSGGALTQIVREGQTSPDANGTYSIFYETLFNDAGQSVFEARLDGTSGGSDDDVGIFRGSGGAITQIAREGQAAPDNNGTISILELPVMNNAGQAAFFATLTGTNGGLTDDKGLFLGSGGALTQIARAGQAAPDANGVFSSLDSSPSLNDAGYLAFEATLNGTSGGSSDNAGIFIGNGGAITRIVRKGQIAPDGNGTFLISGDPELNNAGQVAFRGVLAGTSGGSGDDTGIFRGSGGAITQIAREGQAASDANGTFSFVGNPVLNDSGVAAFVAHFSGTSGGTSDDRGIYIGDGIDLFQVAREGDSVGDSTMTRFFFSGSLNQHGQIAYHATLANGNESIQLWTPELHWRSMVSGTWDSASQWTLGLNPDFVHDVVINPASNLTVTGPAGNTTVRSLQIGGNTGQATLNLQSGTVLTATNGMTIQPTGTLTGNGTIAGSVTNTGKIQVSGGAQVTFLDNVVQNGLMHVSTAGSAVIHGTFSGSGGFVGGGDVFAMGELRPGNSADSVLYDGNLFLGTTTDTFLEIGEPGVDDFDQILVTGDIDLSGDLFVSMIDGYTPGWNEFYLVVDVGGDLFGQFAGLGEGDLVGRFGGRDLFITYTGGNGNDVGLFTAVPEPGTGLILVGILCWAAGSGRKRRCVRASARQRFPAARVLTEHE